MSGEVSRADVIIRLLDPKDHESLLALWAEAGLPARPTGRDARDAFEAQLAEPTAIYLGATLGEELIGSVLATHDGRKGWINRLAVSPAHRRLGLGRRLVEEAEDRLSRLGIEIIACLIEDWNETSMAVFERLGYLKHQDIFYYSKRERPDV